MPFGADSLGRGVGRGEASSSDEDVEEWDEWRIGEVGREGEESGDEGPPNALGWGRAARFFGQSRTKEAGDKLHTDGVHAGETLPF